MQVTSLGRRLSLALSTVATAFFCLLFVHVQVQWLLRLATMGISLCATIMWAILYGWTPTIFATERTSVWWHYPHQLKHHVSSGNRMRLGLGAVSNVSIQALLPQLILIRTC